MESGAAGQAGEVSQVGGETVPSTPCLVTGLGLGDCFNFRWEVSQSLA
jgi:hypothetical protein